MSALLDSCSSVGFDNRLAVISKSTQKMGVGFLLSCDKIENGNGKYVKETTTRPKSRQQPKAINGSSTQRENPAPGDGPQLAPK